MNLTRAQQAALTFFRQFLHNPNEPVFLLRGYAGTGKTFLLKTLLAELQQPAVLLAPTGRAAGVLRQQTQLEASTIHRGIYDFSHLKPLQTGKDDADKSFKFFFGLANNGYPVGTVFVVDEASMVGDAFSESEFFRLGTGHLLADLLRYVRPTAQNGYKLLLVGDRAQLPPVGDRDSWALDAAELSQRLGGAAGVPVREVELTDVVRQQTDSGILANATMVRDALRRGYFAGLRLNRTADVQDVAPGQLLPAYLAAGGGPDAADRAIIITYSNNLARQYNELVRGHFFPGRADVADNDRLIITQNNYLNDEEPIYNGDFATVLSAGMPYTRQVRIHVNKTPVYVPLTWRPVRLRFTCPNGSTYAEERLLLDAFLTSPDRALSANEVKALYIDAVRRCREKHSFDDRHPEFSNFLRQDAHFHALRAKYGYAITCHKAQGGTWHTAFIDFAGFSGRRHAHYFRWVYTALTRASRQVYLLNDQNFTPWEAMRLFDPQAKPPLSVPVPLFAEVVREQTAQFDELTELEARLGIRSLPNTQLQQVRRVAAQLTEAGAEVEQIAPVQYGLRYLLRRGKQRGQVTVYYKDSVPFSSVQPAGPATELTQEAVQRLREPLPAAASAVPVHFDAATSPTLAAYHELFAEAASAAGISILCVRHKPYAEHYQLQHEAGRANLIFDYGKKDCITGVRVDQHDSPELLGKLHSILQALN
ncbi:AAA family ATPase [Hymenobacter sp. BT186]|uniref:AAA family ATPase n=1 Tax=Hymenobacter telluris TaxID=2816474 RepID=A0A939F2E7_9BACT|nr:AAA family ATPase [Hymenobacter telluris]MBO0360860.1 AAA family ATPase [Hymenobacter telluris]MBW3376889.1 AAA family ATPase [Hymenobacter norwichensis]